MRHSSWFFLLIFSLLSLFLLTMADTIIQRHDRRELTATARLTRELGLTDLALFTEARYTRHPSQADQHSAFQDHPMALEHFPTGSIVPIPGHVRP